jgi:hypothetical protein
VDSAIRQYGLIGRYKLGTLVFIILRFGFGINNYGDGQTLATLVSLDTIAFLLLLHFRKVK